MFSLSVRETQTVNRFRIKNENRVFERVNWNLKWLFYGSLCWICELLKPQCLVDSFGSCFDWWFWITGKVSEAERSWVSLWLVLVLFFYFSSRSHLFCPLLPHIWHLFPWHIFFYISSCFWNFSFFFPPQFLISSFGSSAHMEPTNDLCLFTEICLYSHVRVKFYWNFLFLVSQNFE